MRISRSTLSHFLLLNRNISLLFLFVVNCHFLFAQIGQGQFLISGNASFFTNHSVSDGAVSATSVEGNIIPAFTYKQKQDAYNLTFSPKAHYFLSENWSVGLGLGIRRIVSDRYIPSITADQVPTYIAFSRNTKNKSTTSSYAPTIELARHWNITKKLTLTLTAYAGWQHVTIKNQTSSPLTLVMVDDLENWSAGSDGLTFSPENNNLTTSKEKEQHWFTGLFPQVRYAFTERFGALANIGGINLTQEYSNTVDNFNKARPNLSLNLNPTSWSFGLYFILGKTHSDQ